MPRWILYLLLVVVALTLIPMGLIYRSSHAAKHRPRIQVVYDMDQQSYYKNQAENPFFGDDRASRQHPHGTVARGQYSDDEAFWHGTAGADTVFVDAFPMPVTEAMVARGRDRFNIYCAPCHGQSGNGDGLVNRRAQALAEGTWTPPTNLTTAAIAERPVGHIFNTITHGIRKMPAYGPQIEPADRWAIVAWVRALQLSRNATIDDVPADVRATLQ
ncbi:MAG TPA: cytochrome c [Candidatus Krumholzibacteria bacterium]|nr:cytochrome c [Candidatus Krumholzibacteria bacterium]